MLRATTTDDSAETACASDGPQNVLVDAPTKAASPFTIGIETLWPWTVSPQSDVPKYPGRFALIRETFGGRVAMSTVKAWRQGYRPPPQWATELLASLMRQRASELLSAAEALEKKKGAD